MACMHYQTFEIYHNDQLIVPDGYIDIDEEIAPAIQILNRKGYLTEWCCAGHPLVDWLWKSTVVEYEKANSYPSSYIIFKEGISLPALPPEFFNDSHDARVVIRKNYPVGDSFFTISREILEAMEQLYKWAVNLPDFT